MKKFIKIIGFFVLGAIASLSFSACGGGGGGGGGDDDSDSSDSSSSTTTTTTTTTQETLPSSLVGYKLKYGSANSGTYTIITFNSGNVMTYYYKSDGLAATTDTGTYQYNSQTGDLTIQYSYDHYGYVGGDGTMKEENLRKTYALVYSETGKLSYLSKSGDTYSVKWAYTYNYDYTPIIEKYTPSSSSGNSSRTATLYK